MARASIKSYNTPHSRSKGRGKGWHEKAVYVQDAGKRVAPRHREVALRGHHSKPRSTPISSHYSRQLMNRGNIQRTIPKAPKKSYDTGHTIHNVDMVELKQNDVNVFVDGLDLAGFGSSKHAFNVLMATFTGLIVLIAISKPSLQVFAKPLRNWGIYGITFAAYGAFLLRNVTVAAGISEIFEVLVNKA